MDFTEAEIEKESAKCHLLFKDKEDFKRMG